MSESRVFADRLMASIECVNLYLHPESSNGKMHLSSSNRQLTHAAEIAEFHNYSREELAEFVSMLSKIFLLANATEVLEMEHNFPSQLVLPPTIECGGKIFNTEVLAADVISNDEIFHKLCELLKNADMDVYNPRLPTAPAERLDPSPLLVQLEEFREKVGQSISRDSYGL